MAGSLIKAKYKEGTDYVTTEWGPLAGTEDTMVPNYECTRCMYSNIDAAKFNEHLDLKDHRWPFPKDVEMEDDDGHKVKYKGYHPKATSNPFAKPTAEVKK
jgi:hypothetical protein